jgi:DNA-binding CsgD family transcriptional regulator
MTMTLKNHSKRIKASTERLRSGYSSKPTAGGRGPDGAKHGRPSESAMVTIDEFSRVVSAIYASSIHSENWTAALTEISRLLGATGSGLFVGAGNSRSVMSITVPEEVSTRYREHYYTIDCILEAVENGPAGLIRGGPELVALTKHSEFYADFMRPFDMCDGLFLRLAAGTTPTSFLAVAPERSQPFETAERVKFLSAVVPHLQQALHTQNHFAELARSPGDITAVIDTIRHGIVIVEPNRDVVQLNAAAEQILTAGDGLCMRSKRIEASRGSANNHLHSSVSHACVPQQNARNGDSLACTRPSGKRPYIIHVLPLTADDHAPTRVLVMIIDPELEPEPPKMLIRRLFGLTNAEADVALRVMRGDGLKPISEDMALSIATIKTHVHHIFDKTDTHRQAELVRLLLAIQP